MSLYPLSLRAEAEFSEDVEFEKSVTLSKMQFETGTPVNGVAATGVLTIGGVVIHGETVTIGADTYEFAADVAQTVTAGNIPVDIQAHADKAEGTLTIDTIPTAGDDMTIGTKVYTFVAIGAAAVDGDIEVAAALGDAQDNIVAAVNGTDGINVASEFVTMGAFAANDAVLTALVGGVAGNAIDTLTTFTAGTNVFDDTVLGNTTAGTDCTNINGGTELVSEIAANGTEPVTAAGTNVVTLTATVRGTLANAIDTLETMANGAFAAVTLLGGINSTVAEAFQTLYDGNFLYLSIADSTISTANWRRITLSSF